MDQLMKLGHDISKLWDAYGSAYLSGMRDTLILALIATVIGCGIGLVCGILNTIPYSKNDSLLKRFLLKLIRIIVRVYVEVFRGTPMILQAVFIYYGVPYFTNGATHFESMWAAAILIVSINTGAYMAESVRGGIISVDPGQTEGAKAIGMNHVQTMVSVILPQPFILAVILRYLMPKLHARIGQWHELAFYLWAVALTLAISMTVRSIVHSDYSFWYQFGLALISLVACALQFYWGKKIGKKYGQTISAGQSLGQKNTVLAIWMGYTFFTPVTAVVGGFYSVWHNTVNSYQLYQQRKKDKTN